MYGFMGGLNWYVQDMIKWLGEVYLNIEFVLFIVSDFVKQVNDIEDMMVMCNIDGLVVLFFEFELLIVFVVVVKEVGKFVIVVDCGFV